MPRKFTRQACVSCRLGKRKCDRTIPVCSSCSPSELACVYLPRRNRSIASQSQDAGREVRNFITCYNSKITNLNLQTVIQAAQFPVLFFIDSNLFQRESLGVPESTAELPLEYRNAVGSEGIVSCSLE